MQDISQEVIINAAQGDIRAFEEIYRACAEFVYNVALRVARNNEDAQEITQEVFMTMYHKLKTFRFQSSLRTWVYRVTINKALNYVKKTAKTRSQTVEYNDDIGCEQSPGVIETVQSKEAQENIIADLLKTLSSEQAACIILRSVEGFSYEEIAQTLKININAVRSRLKRAREKLMAGKKEAVGHEM